MKSNIFWSTGSKTPGANKPGARDLHLGARGISRLVEIDGGGLEKQNDRMKVSYERSKRQTEDIRARIKAIDDADAVIASRG